MRSTFSTAASLSIARCAARVLCLYAPLMPLLASLQLVEAFTERVLSADSKDGEVVAAMVRELVLASKLAEASSAEADESCGFVLDTVCTANGYIKTTVDGFLNGQYDALDAAGGDGEEDNEDASFGWTLRAGTLCAAAACGCVA